VKNQFVIVCLITTEEKKQETFEHLAATMDVF